MASPGSSDAQFDTALAAHIILYSVELELRAQQGDHSSGLFDFSKVCSSDLMATLDSRGTQLIERGQIEELCHEYPDKKERLEAELNAYLDMLAIVMRCNRRCK